MAARTVRGLAAALVVAGLMGCTSGPHQWSAEVERTFFWACRDTAASRGLDEDRAETYCKCSLRGAQTKLSQAALGPLEAYLAAGMALPDSMTEIIGACLASSSAY